MTKNLTSKANELTQKTFVEAKAARAYFPAIQAIRGMAAAMVVLHHMFAAEHLNALYAQLPNLVRIALTFGWGGVPVFFALSGFVVSNSLNGQHIELRYVGHFIVRRSIRLDPPYWASIVLLLSLEAASGLATGRDPDPISTWQLLTHVTYTQLFAGVPQLGGVYWTLTYEVQFYLVLVTALMVKQAIASHVGSHAAGAIIHGGMLLVAVIWGISGMAPALHPAAFTTFWASFFVGVLAYHARTTVSARVMLAILILLLLIAGSPHSRFAAITAVLLLAVTVLPRGGWLEAPWLQRLGVLSYSLYLTHNPVSGAVFYLARRALPGGALAQIAHFIMATTACLATAWLFWKFIETPIQAIARTMPRNGQSNKVVGVI